jgi:hypothetical protein
MTLDARELRDLAHARSLLEHPSFAARLVNVIGAPVERGIEKLPAPVVEKIQQATHTALGRALDVAVNGLDRDPERGPANLFHRAMTGIAGAAGGAMGLSALLVELPVTTTLMLRSIADIARSQGEDLDELEARLACLSVFAFGGRSESDDATETGYFAVRAVLAQQVAEAARALATRGIARGEVPALVRLISSIAARFGIVVSEKAAAQLVPVFGGISGAAVNMVVTEHFQRMATGHFIVRRLERRHGADAVRAAYDERERV